MRKFYGFEDPGAYEYFTVHEQADREHAAVERAMLRRLVTDENFAAVKGAAQRILDSLWNLLSGVCQRHAIAC